MKCKEESVIAFRTNALIQKRDYNSSWLIALLALLTMLSSPIEAAAARRDKQLPTVPTGLIVTPVSCSQVDLSWNASTDVGSSGLSGYYLYRNGVLIKKVLAPATTTSDAGLSQGTLYTYAVMAVDNAGNKSAKSSPVSTTTPPCASCSFAVSPSAASVDAAACNGTLTVTAGSGCTWTPSSTAPAWLSCTPPSGISSGTLTWFATANTSSSPRTGTLNIGDQTFTVSQAGAPCNFTISPSSATVGAAAGGGTLSVIAAAGCVWTPSSSAPAWLTCTPANGTGSGVLTWSCAANTSTTPRSATLTIGGQIFAVTQAGAGCTFAISPGAANVGAAAVSGTLTVMTDPNCGWTASSSSPTWLTCTPASGIGGGAVTWSVSANSSCTPRSSMITVGGQIFAVNQAGASGTFSILPTSASIAAAGGSGSVNVTANSGCGWTASSSASWITVSAGGTGSGAANYSVQPNSSSSTRSSTLTIAGQTFLVTQAGAVDTIAPSVALTAPTGGSTVSGTINLAANASDNVGVTRVEFYCEGTMLLGTATASPWTATCNTTTLPNGSHSFSCKAYDGAGNTAASLAVLATVDNATNTATATGQFVWSKYAAGPLTSDWINPFSSQTDSNGNVFVAGAFSGTMDLGGSRLVATGDADIFVAKYSSSGPLLWAKRFGDVAGDYGYSIAVDKNGDVFVSGCFSGTVDFGGGALVSAGSSDIFVAKLSSAGTHVWSKRFGGTGSDAAYGVAADKDGNVVLMGWFGSGFAAGREVDFGGGLLSSVGSYDIFVAKLSGTGSHLWSKRYGGAGIDRPKSLAVDGNGDVLLAAQFENMADYGGGSLSSAGYEDVVIAKYSGATGGHIWSKRFGGALSDSVAAVTVDGTGNVSFTGMFGSTIDFNGVPITTVGLGDIYLAKFNSSGGHVWSKTFISGQTGRDGVKAIAVDKQGNVIITGGILSALSFGGAALTNPFGSGTVDTFVAKFSATGAHLWSNRYGGYNDDWAATATTDRSDNVFVVGQFYGSMQFGTGEQTNTGGYDGFVAKFAP